MWFKNNAQVRIKRIFSLTLFLRICRWVYFFCLFFCFVPLWSEQSASVPPKKWIIREIIIKNSISISKTRLLTALGLQQGMVVRAKTVASLKKMLRRRLENLRFFYKVAVALKKVQGYSIDLLLTLKEKATFFPLPVVSYSQGRWTMGGGFIESNFFGTMNRLAMLAFWEDGNFNLAGYYAFRSLFVKDFFLTLYLLYSKKPTYEYSGTSEVKEYVKIKKGGTFDFVYWLHERFRVTCRMDLIDYHFDGSGVLPQSAFGWLADFSLIYEGLDTREDYLVGVSFRLSWGRDLVFLGSELDRMLITWKLRAAFSPGWKHNFVVTQLGAFSSGLQYGYFFEVGGRRNSYVPGIRGYKIDQFKARHYVNTLFEYRVPVWSNGFFIYSFVPFVDHVFFSGQTDLGRLKSCASYGLSVRVYLRKLLIPAFILYGVYVEGNNEWSGGMSLGAQF